MIGPILLLSVAWLSWRLIRFVFSPKSQINNLPGPPSPSWLTGNLPQIYDRQGWEFHRELLKYGPVSRLQQVFGQSMLCVYDPAALHSIVVKDQHVFEELEWFLNFTFDTFGPGVLSTVGEAHRKQRKLLNPVFSSKNLKRITPVFYEVVGRLVKGIRTLVANGTSEVDMAEYLSRTALELAGKATIGHSFDPLTEANRDPYTEALKAYLPALNSLSNWFPIYRILRPIIPVPLRRPLMNSLPSRRVKCMLNSIDMMEVNAVKLYNEKKRAAEEAGMLNKQDHETGAEKAKDLITVLLYANAGASEADALPETELISQLSTLLFAATDTTSSALTITLQRLSQNPDVQDKLRNEVREARQRYDGDDIPYDDLLALPYLDAVCRETLRVNAVAPLRFREARADAVLPLSKPIRGLDGTIMRSLFVPKGTLLFVPVQAANLSSDLWGADAEEWRPERWLAPLPDALTEAKIPGVYSNLMTFWGGGRACIGFKFSQLEMKVVLAELLMAFKFEEGDKPITWNIAEVIHPTVGTESMRPELPMKVTAL